MNQPDSLADHLLGLLGAEPRALRDLAASLRSPVDDVRVAALALRRRGYALVDAPPGTLRLEAVHRPLTGDEIEQALGESRLGCPLHTYGRIGSTNQAAWRLAESGAPEGSLVTAEEQTQGRGRQGRPWHSPPGVGIWMSLVLRPRVTPAAASGLPLVAAIALAAAVRSLTGEAARIKWPNDVLLQDRKIAGILGESAVEGQKVKFAVLGIGINVNQAVEDFPKGFVHPAGSIAIATGRSWSRPEVLAGFLRAFEPRYGAYSSGEFEALRDEFRDLSNLIGRQVRIIRTSGELSATVVDVSPEGALFVTSAAGPMHIPVGEASLRYD